MVATRELNNSPNTTEIACGVISSGNDPTRMHVSNASIGMFGSTMANFLHELHARGYRVQRTYK